MNEWLAEYRTRGSRLRRWVNGVLIALGAAFFLYGLIWGLKLLAALYMLVAILTGHGR